METEWLKKLTQLVPPPSEPVNPGTPEMRLLAEEKLGTRLPDDYIELINTYGDGFFGYAFSVYSPFTDDRYFSLLDNVEEAYYQLAREYEKEETLNPFIPGVPEAERKEFESRRGEDGKVPLYHGYCDDKGYPFNYYPEEEGLLACCQCDGQFTVYWKTGGDRWTIVAYDRGGEYSGFDMSLTEFLYKELTGEINFSDLYFMMTEKGKVFLTPKEHDELQQ